MASVFFMKVKSVVHLKPAGELILYRSQAQLYTPIAGLSYVTGNGAKTNRARKLVGQE